ncbi:hypothetical protein DPMN_111665 [Dreissena polymorpha]|uniref:Uncharacterized protein n=1 Tax=Dreissena polymorpha TaxID=45954 RepID=A0A9D4KFD8_DREPO|nr:hypothetical protein DPMN_111665 [Dreissena polymorpha]
MFHVKILQFSQVFMCWPWSDSYEMIDWLGVSSSSEMSERRAERSSLTNGERLSSVKDGPCDISPWCHWWTLKRRSLELLLLLLYPRGRCARG